MLGVEGFSISTSGKRNKKVFGAEIDLDSQGVTSCSLFLFCASMRFLFVERLDDVHRKLHLLSVSFWGIQQVCSFFAQTLQ